MIHKKEKKNLVLYGDSDYAELIKYYFESDSEYKVVGFCVDKRYRTREILSGLPVVDFEELEKYFPKKNNALFTAVGYKNMRAKKMMYERASASGYHIATYISKSATIDSSNKIGENCMILPGCILEPFSSVESNTFLNTGVTVCHHSTIGSHSFMAARSLVGGYSSVGENSFIGFQATVLQQLKLAPETLIGAGSIMMCNSTQSTMYVGIPAKAIKSHHNKGIEII